MSRSLSTIAHNSRVKSIGLGRGSEHFTEHDKSNFKLLNTKNHLRVLSILSNKTMSNFKLSILSNTTRVSSSLLNQIFIEHKKSIFEFVEPNFYRTQQEHLQVENFIEHNKSIFKFVEPNFYRTQEHLQVQDFIEHKKSIFKFVEPNLGHVLPIKVNVVIKREVVNASSKKPQSTILSNSLHASASFLFRRHPQIMIL